MKSSHSKSNEVQGEGDYASARKYNEHARSFAASGQAERAAKAAAPRNAREQEAMRNAEAEGRSRAKGGAHPGPAQDPRSRAREEIEKQAPGKHPQGRNPTPEKLPGR